MKVVYFQKEYHFNKPTIILGSFQSFHIGHYQLLKKAKEEGHNGEIVVLLFENKNLLKGDKKIVLETLKVRLKNLANLGINGVIIVKFDHLIKNLTGPEFIEKLVNLYQPQKMICGSDFKYGRFAKWDVYDLKQQFQNTIIVPILKKQNSKISSSLIEEMIYYGQLDEANKFLITNWTTYGFIDRNFVFCYENPHLKLQPGIYLATLEYENFGYPVVIHINLKKVPTIYFLEKTYQFEGRNVFIKWDHKLRTIVKETEDGFINNDKDEAVRYLAKNL